MRVKLRKMHVKDIDKNNIKYIKSSIRDFFIKESGKPILFLIIDDFITFNHNYISDNLYMFNFLFKEKVNDKLLHIKVHSTYFYITDDNNNKNKIYKELIKIIPKHKVILYLINHNKKIIEKNSIYDSSIDYMTISNKNEKIISLKKVDMIELIDIHIIFNKILYKLLIKFISNYFSKWNNKLEVLKLFNDFWNGLDNEIQKLKLITLI